VPPDYYQVQIAVGDATAASGPATAIVEGSTWMSGATTQAGEFLTASARVLVLDGFLDVTIGEAGGTTALAYVSLAALPKDLDGDGVNNFADNCVDIANPTQQDTDIDGSGDACDPCPLDSFNDLDQDGFCANVDNCPTISNPSQADQDLDNHGDACDCAPTQSGAFALPMEVENLRASGASTTTVSWDSQAALVGAGVVYDVLTEPLSTLASGSPFQAVACLHDDLAATEKLDSSALPAGAGFLYLVRAQNACGSGTYGSGAGREALDSGAIVACP
jgi:hypothetical protein